jgi:uncharacterized protein (TIGR02147 family)
MVSVFDHIDYRAFLAAWYKDAKAASRAVSYRSIATKVGYASPGFFTQILQGKTNISLSTAEGFAELTGLKGRSREYFLNMVDWNQAKDDKSRQKSLAKLEKFREFKIHDLKHDQERFLETWHHAAIREIIGIKPFQGDYTALANSLDPPITSQEAKDSIELLLALGLAARTSRGVERRDAALSAGHAIDSATTNGFFRELHALGLRALDHFPKSDRNLSWVTLSVSESARAEILDELRTFRRKALEIASRDSRPGRVHQLTMMLHPLSKPLLTDKRT